MEEMYSFMSNYPSFSYIMFGSGFHVSYMGWLRNGGLCAFICCHIGMWLKKDYGMPWTPKEGGHVATRARPAMRRTPFDTSSRLGDPRNPLNPNPVIIAFCLMGLP